MSTKSDALGLMQAPEGSLQPSVPINANADQVAQLLAGAVTRSLTSDANYTLVAADYQTSVLSLTSSVLTTGRDIEFPAYFSPMLVLNGAGQTLTLKKSGQTGVTVDDGESIIVYCGASDVLSGGGGGGGALADGDYGDLTVSGGGAAMAVKAGAISYAKMQGISAQRRVLGRNSAGSGVPEEVTLSQLLDWVGSAANGDILYRSAGSWTRLAVGTNGHVLTLVSGLPTWAAGGGGSGLSNFTEGLNTSSPNATVPVVYLNATNAAANVDIAIVPKGVGSISAHVADALVAGGSKRGQCAVDLQLNRNNANQVASGTYSGLFAGLRNRASGAQSGVFLGNTNHASGDDAVALGGNNSTVSGGAAATVGGNSCTASGAGAVTIGGLVLTASGNYSIAWGTYGNSRGIENADAGGCANGRQRMGVPLYANTADATPTVLRSNASAAAATNQYAIPSGRAAMLRVQVIARQTAGTGTGDCAGWDTAVCVKNIGGTTTLVGAPSVAKTFNDAGASAWTIAITANDTLDTLKVEVTGEASKTIQWTAYVTGPEG